MPTYDVSFMDCGNCDIESYADVRGEDPVSAIEQAYDMFVDDGYDVTEIWEVRCTMADEE